VNGKYVVVLTLEHRVVGGFDTVTEASNWLAQWLSITKRSRLGFVTTVEPPFVEVETEVR
jgi:hypothetical protein